MADQQMIEVTDLHKHYGPIRAVDGISFTVDRGEIVGFLGPNGAGKSTTMKMLTTFIAPTSGRVRVADFDVQENSLEVRRRVGYLPEDTPLYKTMTVLEFLRFVADIREVSGSQQTARLKRVIETCGVGEVLGQIIGTLSKGYRQRVGLAQALVHDPDILILDEPTSGLDPNQIVEIRTLIKELGKEKTLILSTHILSEVEASCDRVLIIDRGEVVADGPRETLVAAKESESGYLLHLDAEVDADGVSKALDGIAGVAKVSATRDWSGNDCYLVATDGGVDPRLDIMRACLDKEWPIEGLAQQQANLETVFRSLTQHDSGKEED